MRQKVITFFLILLIIFSVSGCTQNEVARQYGGTVTVELPKGQKLVNASWKETNLWYLYRPMHPGEYAEKYTYQEDSGYGILEGKVIFVETK